VIIFDVENEFITKGSGLGLQKTYTNCIHYLPQSITVEEYIPNTKDIKKLIKINTSFFIIIYLVKSSFLISF